MFRSWQTLLQLMQKMMIDMRIISGAYRNRKLLTPKSPLTRPTAERTREAFFNICQHRIQDTNFLDICAGSGGVGFEALSRGARFVTFIDSHRESVACIKKNASQLECEEECAILEGDLFFWLKKLEKANKTFDLIFADPPYGIKNAHPPFLSEQILLALDASSLLTPTSLLCIEESIDYTPQIQELRQLELYDCRKFGHTAMQLYKIKTS